MKKVFLNIVVGVISLFFMISFISCDDEVANTESATVEPTNTGSAPKDEVPGSSVIMKINGFGITNSIYKIMLYNKAGEIKEENEPEEGQDYDEWEYEFFRKESTFKFVREHVIDDLKKYAYLQQCVKENNISMDSADVVDFEQGIIESIYDEYNEEDPDEYFLLKYGVTKREYLDYEISIKLNKMYMESQYVKQDVSESLLEEYKDLYSDYFKEKEIGYIYLAFNDENRIQKMALAEELLNKVKNNENMIALATQYSEDGSEDTTFKYSPSSDDSENSYTQEIRTWVNGAAVGDSGIVEADGIYILKCEDIYFTEDVNERIKKYAGKEVYENNLHELYSEAKYEPTIDDKVYNSYTKFPGDLANEE